MDVQGQVLTVDLEFEGKTYTASYFLEQDIIQANIEGRLFTTVKGIGSAEETVRALLFEWVLQNAAGSKSKRPPELSP
ncbi:MAG: hypothetical protein EOP04_12565 [Proteobacteria bacterium]|nr:MAG: hypothetical protein EOP04_12565 [Pseudomonadota bacterium]